jgi:hypothetical protein
MPTQNTNIYNPSNPAIQYSGVSQTWKIGKNVGVGSGTVYAVYSIFNNSKLINKGYIYSHGNAAVYCTGDNAKFVNKASGIVSGLSSAIAISTGGDSATIINSGKLYGGQSGIVSLGPGDLIVKNYGEVYGHDNGIFLQPSVPGSTSGPSLVNNGKISSDFYGIYANNFGGFTTKIVNDDHGIIKGSSSGAAIYYAGKLNFANEGKVKGDIFNGGGGPTNDKVVNKGVIKGEVYLGPGDDTFKSKDGKAGRLHGQEGNDKFVLGSTADKIVFDTALNAATNVDRVKHFDPGTDKFYLDDDVFTTLPLGQLNGTAFHKGPSATSPTDRIIYHKSTGEVSYDPDGTGGSPQTLFAKVDPGTNLHASDFIVIA